MRMVLTGATGRIGAYLRDALNMRGVDVVPWSGSTCGDWNGTTVSPVDLTDPRAIRRSLDVASPDVVLHAAAISDAEAVRSDPNRARRVNVDAVTTIAEWCADHHRRLLFTSTDMVFDGSQAWSNETDEARPILAYGASKRAAEIEAAKAPDSVIIRICLLYGPTRNGRETFYDRAVARLRAGVPQTFFHDEYRTPLDYQSGAEAIASLVTPPVQGVVHVGGTERLSRYDLMRRVAVGLGLDPSLVRSNSREEVTFVEPRPADVSLDTNRLAAVLPKLERPPVEEAVRAMELASRNGVDGGWSRLALE